MNKYRNFTQIITEFKFDIVLW